MSGPLEAPARMTGLLPVRTSRYRAAVVKGPGACWARSFSRKLAATALVLLTVTSCARSEGLTSSSRCADFIHAAWEDRAAFLEQVRANQRIRPNGVAVPTVEAVSMICDAYPEMALTEAMRRATPDD
jgi:hypothetical protein